MSYIIATDLDGVGYNFVDQFRLFVNQHTGKHIREMSPAKQWNFFEDWGFTGAEYNELVCEGLRQGFVFRKGKAIDGFRDAMEYIAKVRGDKIKVITARGFVGLEDIAYEATEKWLDENGIIYDEIILTGDKSEPEYDILIDDAPHHIEDAIMMGKGAILFDQAWNRHMTYPPRGKGWKGVLEYIDKTFPVISSQEVAI